MRALVFNVRGSWRNWQHKDRRQGGRTFVRADDEAPLAIRTLMQPSDRAAAASWSGVRPSCIFNVSPASTTEGREQSARAKSQRARRSLMNRVTDTLQSLHTSSCALAFALRAIKNSHSRVLPARALRCRSVRPACRWFR